MYWIRFAARRIYLFLYLLKKHFLRMFLSSLGLLVSLVFIFSILGVLRPLKKEIVKQFESALPEDTIVVRAPQEKKTVSLISGIFKTQSDVAIGIVNTKIKPMYEWEEVKTISRTQFLQKPILATIDHPMFADIGVWFDLPIQGISPEMVAGKCDAPFVASSEVNREGKRIPVIPLVVPNAVADIMYAYTIVNNLPQITKKDLTGIRIKMSIGQSILRQDSKAGSEATGIICGFVSPEIITFAGAPIAWVRSMHEKSGQNRAANHYDRLFLGLHNIKDREGVEKRVRSLGLEHEGSQRQLETLYNWLAKIDYIVWGTAAALIILATISMFNSFLIMATQKKYEFGLYLVFGASPVFLLALMFLEGAFWGGFHSAIAFAISEAFSSELQTMVNSLPALSAFGGEPLTFQISPLEKFSLIFGAILFSGGSSLLAGFYLSSRKTLSLVKKD